MFHKPKYLTIKARLRQPTFANYYEYYHNGTPGHATLDKIVNDHKFLVGEQDFKNPLTAEGFYFKSDKAKCLDFGKKITMIDNILDRDAILKLKVQPYDFKVDGKRLVGVSITLLEARAVPDKN